MPKEKHRGRILWLLGSVVSSLVLAELILRMAGVSYPVFEQYDAELGKGLRPGANGWYSGEGGAFIQINEAGYRDVRHPVDKEEGVYRIAVLGDSFVEARQVALENTFWRLLEDLVQECPVGVGRTVEVLSFGVSGFSTGQELLVLRRDVEKYRPDLVLLNFFSGNDLAENGTGELRPRFRLDSEGRVLTQDPPAPSRTGTWRRLKLWGVQHSRLLEVVNQVARKLGALRFKNDHQLVWIDPGLSLSSLAPPRTEAQGRDWLLAEALVSEVYREARDQGAEFLLVTATQPVQVDPNPGLRHVAQTRLGVAVLDYAEKRLARLGVREGFPVLNLVYAFRDYAERQDVHLHGFPNTRLSSGHWNEKGHALAAQLIAEKICIGSI